MPNQRSPLDASARRLTLFVAPAASPSHIAPQDDERLLRALERGEPGVGAEVYDRLLPVVDSALFRIVGCRDTDHADLVQSVFEQIVATLSRKKFRGRCSLVGWASVLACHVGLNALRSRRRERRVIERGHELDPEQSPGSESLEREAAARGDLSAIRACLSEMDEGRVAALLLHAMGHDLAEIAELTGTTAAAAQSRLSRGRRELRERLDARASIDGPPATQGGEHGD